MTFPTLDQAKLFFRSDNFIFNRISDDRIQYWLDDLQAKDIVSESQFGTLYFNAVLNLLGHFIYYYELGVVVSTTGAPISSESTSQVSRSFDTSRLTAWNENLGTTKYGRFYLYLLSQTAQIYAGLVAC